MPNLWRPTVSVYVDEVIEALQFERHLENLARERDHQRQHKPKQISKKEGRKT